MWPPYETHSLQANYIVDDPIGLFNSNKASDETFQINFIRISEPDMGIDLFIVKVISSSIEVALLRMIPMAPTPFGGHIFLNQLGR